MKKTKTILLLGLILALSAMACQIGGIQLENTSLIRSPGEIIEETRSISDVSGVVLAIQGHMIIEVGENESLIIEGEDNIIEDIESDIRNGVLYIKSRNNLPLRDLRPIYYYLTVTDLNKIVISSSGNIEAPDLKANHFSITLSSSGDLVMGDLETETLTVKLSSSGHLKMGELEADSLDVNLSSSGDMDILGGEVGYQDITVSSSGSYQARELESETADVLLSSSGSATILVKDQLNANLTSSGDLRYLGNPDLDVSISSSGRITNLDD